MEGLSEKNNHFHLFLLFRRPKELLFRITSSDIFFPHLKNSSDLCVLFMILALCFTTSALDAVDASGLYVVAELMAALISTVGVASSTFL